MDSAIGIIWGGDKGMKGTTIISLILLVFVACKKDTETDESKLPDGAIPYTDSELSFVPYSATNQQFKKGPEFTQTLTFEFKERITPATFYAWDQTYFTLSTDPGLEVELRFRYLQAEEESLKTLAIYMPYRNAAGKSYTSVFEMPIDPAAVETGFFSELIIFHASIALFDTNWENVFEVSPINTATPENDSPTRFEKIYYNRESGIIGMNQKNGDQWVLIP